MKIYLIGLLLFIQQLSVAQDVFDQSTQQLSLENIKHANSHYSANLVWQQNNLFSLLSSSETTTQSTNNYYNSTTNVVFLDDVLVEDLHYYARLSYLDNQLFQLDSSTVKSNLSFNLSDTGQVKCFDNSGQSSTCSSNGQDADVIKNQPNYFAHSNGTVTDLNTQLMWQQSSDTNQDGSINADDKFTQSAAISYCESLTLADYNDWRLPNIKEMYSLINFSGTDISAYGVTSDSQPFIDTNTFAFAYGDTAAGERPIDVQYATTTNYVSTTMNGDETMFGVNLADGRIKGYPVSVTFMGEKTYNVMCVRGKSYGQNQFVDNNNQTISDQSTGLMWQQGDSEQSLNWYESLNYCENLDLANQRDWRLPNAKELQSIVDYTRSPDTTNSAAIDPLFKSTSMTNEAGQTDWHFYWTSTTHKSDINSGESGVYIAFGRALGNMFGQWLDVHGAGAQRSNFKQTPTEMNNSYQSTTDANGNVAITHGPQGDVVRIDNMVRCVRDE